MKRFLNPLKAPFLWAILSASCNEADLSSGDLQAAAAESAKEANTVEVTTPPDAAIPVAIGGAYLHLKCAQEVHPTATNAEALIGCRLENELSQRKPAASLGSAYQFDWIKGSATDVQVGMRTLTDDPRYDVVYYLRSSTLASLDQSMSLLQIRFSKALSEAPREMLAGKLAEIIVSAASIPEAGTTDYSAISRQLADAMTQPTPPLPEEI